MQNQLDSVIVWFLARGTFEMHSIYNAMHYNKQETCQNNQFEMFEKMRGDDICAATIKERLFRILWCIQGDHKVTNERSIYY